MLGELGDDRSQVAMTVVKKEREGDQGQGEPVRRAHLEEEAPDEPAAERSE